MQILGIDVNSTSKLEAVTTLRHRLLSRRPTKLAFANAHLLNITYENTNLHQIMQDFLIFNDGIGVNIASRLLYGRWFQDNLNGTDFVPFFLDHCEEPLNIFLLGATEEVVNKTRNVFIQRWPLHRIVGVQHGYFSDNEFANIKQLIVTLQPHIVFVAMGNGRQERLASELVPEAAVSAWCIGALFDFLTGQIPRAPYLMRRFGAEWLFRLFIEPQRMWHRYIIGNPKFLFRVIRQKLSI
jgi:exopolysaccharide biosynthesis WecB/TagA/CpsF family protein